MITEYEKAAAYIQSKISGTYKTCIVLGSGYNELIHNIPEKTVIPYSLIPGFLQSTVPGHSGEMVFCRIQDKNILFMAGRFHYYEGHSMQAITHYIRVLKLIGIENLILTNAAGGINEHYQAGDLVVIKDHIKLSLDSPLFGENAEMFGPRFPDMSQAYHPDFIQLFEQAFEKNHTAFQTGVYAMMGGPQFETPAEIRMLKMLGADMVGMSTVPEVIVANHCGMKVAGVSLISNLAAGISKNPLSHEEVMEEGKKATSKFFSILLDFIGGLPC